MNRSHPHVCVRVCVCVCVCDVFFVRPRVTSRRVHIWVKYTDDISEKSTTSTNNVHNDREQHHFVQNVPLFRRSVEKINISSACDVHLRVFFRKHAQCGDVNLFNVASEKWHVLHKVVLVVGHLRIKLVLF